MIGSLARGFGEVLCMSPLEAQALASRSETVRERDAKQVGCAAPRYDLGYKEDEYLDQPEWCGQMLALGLWAEMPHPMVTVLHVHAAIGIGELVGEAAWDGCMPGRTLARAIDRVQAGELVLDLNSPGGAHAAMPELIGALTRAKERGVKVTAVAHPRAMSLAYWLGCACDAFVAAPGSTVGNVGSIIVLYDLSAMFAEMGVEPVVVATGSLKGLGVPGAEITAEQRAFVQSKVDSAGGEFMAAVASRWGKSVEDVKAEQAKWWGAEEAKAAGYIDEVMDFDALVLRAIASARGGTGQTPRSAGMVPSGGGGGVSVRGVSVGGVRVG